MPRNREPNNQDEKIESVIDNYESRREISNSLLGFGLLYFSHYLYLPPGDFHKGKYPTLDG